MGAFDDIEDLVVGERPTYLEAEYGNQTVKALHILGNISIEKGSADSVNYSDDGVQIIYGGDLSGYTGTIKMFDAEDITKRWVIGFEEGTIITVTSEASGWEEKIVELCEDGSAVEYTFLIKTPDP